MNENEPFGRQPLPVKVIFEGDPRDVDVYIRRFRAIVESGSYDHVTRTGPGSCIIYPRAVND